jgi:ABC-type bacteriocin/lantibiotic exporter with double-glycine peptidase domain
MPVNLRNVPHFKQEFPFSCLAACARMILAFYGVLHTEEEIRRQLGTGPHGTPARSLFLLRSLGFEVRIEESNLRSLRIH